MLMIHLIINKSAEMDAIALAQMLEQMKGPNFVPLVGWVGKAMDEIKQFLH